MPIIKLYSAKNSEQCKVVIADNFSDFVDKAKKELGFRAQKFIAKNSDHDEEIDDEETFADVLHKFQNPEIEAFCKEEIFIKKDEGTIQSQNASSMVKIVDETTNLAIMNSRDDNKEQNTHWKKHYEQKEAEFKLLELQLKEKDRIISKQAEKLKKYENIRTELKNIKKLEEMLSSDSDRDPSSDSDDGSESLEPGMHLKPDTFMESVNKHYRAIFTKEGDFALFAFPGSMSILWSTKTAGMSAQKLVMQRDGNLVMYDNDGKAIWASGTHGNGLSRARLQDDGNFVIYDMSGKATWNTETGELCKSCSTLKPGQLLTLGGQMMSPNRLYKAVLELDGIFAIYRDNSVIWTAKTQGRRAKNLVMQRDGNLVMYDKESTAIWASGTHRRGESSLTLDDFGRLIVYDSKGAASWSNEPIDSSMISKNPDASNTSSNEIVVINVGFTSD